MAHDPEASDERDLVDGRWGPATVVEALNRVLESETFKSAPKSRRSLAYIVTETAAGRGQQIKERVLSRAVLDRPASLDTRLDATGRVHVARLRSRLERYYAGEGRLDPVRISVPLGQYAAVFTPNVQEQPPAPRPVERAAGTRGPALAVCRLRHGGSAGPDRRAAIGLTESLVQALTRFPGLRIIGPVDPADRAGIEPDVVELGTRTGASFLLQGTVRASVDLLRVTVRLSDTSTGEVRWSDSFDRRTDEFTGFGAEDDVVAQITSAVADYHGVILHSPDGRRHPADDPQVYDAICGYYTFLDDLDPAAAGPTLDALERAAVAEPDNPLVLSTLGSMFAVDVLLRGAAAEVSMERAEQLGRAALAIDPGSTQGHSILGIVSLARGDQDAARHHARTILRLTPHHPAQTYIAGMLLEATGDWDEGIDIIRRSVRITPRHPGHRHTLLAIDGLLRGDIAGALAEASLLDFPSQVYGPLLRAICYHELGLVDRARQEVDRLLELRPDFLDRPAEILASAPTLPPHVVDLLARHTEALRADEAVGSGQ